MEKRETVEIKCDTCGRWHNTNGTTCVTVHGNVCVGLGGGIIGNNFEECGPDDPSVLKNVSCYCFPACFIKIFNDAFNTVPGAEEK